jgi:hypothetical protein
MVEMVHQDVVYVPSRDVVAREIEGELIIVPVSAGIGGSGDELYTLNETGTAIWGRLDGQRSLNDVIRELAAEFDADESVIRGDVLGLIEELVQRKIVMAV